MKRFFIFAYLAIFILIIVAGTSNDIGQKYPFWLIISGVIFPALGAISILLYGLNYHPKRLTTIWKVVPFILLGYYALSYYFDIFIFVEPNDTFLINVIATVIGSILLFPAFYLSFWFGYSKRRIRDATADNTA